MARPRTHPFEKGEVHGCWKLLETFPVASRFVKALCIVCNETVKEVEYTVLHRGKSKHCGCKSTTKDVIYAGNELKNFKIVEVLKYPQIIIRCLSCDTAKEIDKYRFLKKKNTKCPTCDVSKKSQIEIGDTYHFLKVIGIPENRSVECRCVCNKVIIVDYVALLRGDSRSCGCKSTEFRQQTLLLRNQDKLCARCNCSLKHRPFAQMCATCTRYEYRQIPQNKLKACLRGRLNEALKGRQKMGSAVKDLGCTVAELIEHLENQFAEGMSWDNYGLGKDKWNVDHIMPLASFDLTNRTEFLKACHYTNLQPLWTLDNIQKGAKVSD